MCINIYIHIYIYVYTHVFINDKIHQGIRRGDKEILKDVGVIVHLYKVLTSKKL